MLDKAKLERLERALNPRAVAVIGATKEEDRVGYQILESLIMGGYTGQIYPIHPRHKSIFDKKVYPSLDAVEMDPELAIIALNEKATIKVVKECGEHNVKGAVCVAGGYKEIGKGGEELQQKLTETAISNNVLLIGPNTLGVINAQAKLNATFWPFSLPSSGSVSVISQSGGVGQRIVFKMNEEGVALNKWFGVGNRAILGFSDFLQYLMEDPTTDVIAVFLEGTEKAREFMQVAGDTVLRKPVIILKAGKHSRSQEFTMTHTGSMAGSYKMYRDIFLQFGLIPVESVAELVSVCKALSQASAPHDDQVAVLTPSAGPSIMVGDQLLNMGHELSDFSPATVKEIKHVFKNVPVVIKNPLDASAAGYNARSYLELADILLKDSDVDILLAINIDHKNRTFPAEELVSLSQRHGKPILVYYISSPQRAKKYRQICQKGGVPFYTSAEEIVWGAAALINRREASRRD